MPIDWNPPLRRKAGGQFFLAGLDIYHDFEWQAGVQARGGVQFHGGRSLALATRRGLPCGEDPVSAPNDLKTMRLWRQERPRHTTSS